VPHQTASATPLPAALSRRIDLICDDFERRWQEGAPRSIEDYLRTADVAWAPALRAELIQLELELRCRRGDRPPPADYQKRFPECAGAMGTWLLEAQSAAQQLSSTEHRGGGATKDQASGTQPQKAAPPTAAGTLPRYLGEYEVLEKLGAGGMGEVYRAKHRRLGKLVALKVLPAARVGDAALARFHREMEAVGQLDHPHLAEAFDAGEQDGIVYLVLKLIDGIDLNRLVKQSGPRPVAEACELVRQAALGLHYLHGRGLVHRDIKPSNLMRTKEGIVKVLDLGLARWQAAPGPDDLTSPNQAMGTPDYMAPEQTNNAAAVDIRADLYSLGATLFCLLAGRPPFAHYSDMLAKMLAHSQEAPADVRSLRPEVPAGVAAIVARLLAKQPGQRYAAPMELVKALVPFCTPNKAAIAKDRTRPAAAAPGLPTTVVSPTPSGPRLLRQRRRRPVLVLLAGLAVLLAIPTVWFGVAMLMRSRNPTPEIANRGQAASGGTETSGGSVARSGGSVATTGGSATASGGSATATGGSATATGGSATATGGSATATGGSASASGGSATASGGSASGSGLTIRTGTSHMETGGGGNGPEVIGSGTVRSVTRPLAGFSAITLRGAGQVTVLPGAKEEVILKADDNLLPLLISEVRGGTLTLGFKNGSRVQVNQPVEFEVRVKTLKALQLSGNWSLEAKEIRGERLEIEALSGNGTLTVSGRVDEFQLTVKSGNWIIQGKDLPTRRALVHMGGNVKAVVNVSDLLDVTLHGNALVDYLGSPQVRQSGSRKGQVRKIPAN